MAYQVGIVVPRILHRTRRILAARGPPGLADHDVHVPIADRLGGGVDGVKHCVEHVGVGDAGVGVSDAPVRLEERVVRHLRRVAEVGVGVHHERRAGLAKELEHRSEYRPVVATAEPGQTWWFRS